jgi:hypothetical protein
MRFTLAGDTLFGSRQMAGWLRSEFSAEWEKEQARQRVWVAVERGEVTPSDPAIPPPLPRAVDGTEAVAPWRLEPDADTLLMPAPPPQGAAPAQAFDLFNEETAAPRSLRNTPLVKPLKDQEQSAGRRRSVLYIVIPGALALLAGLWFIFTPPERAHPGKFVITPSPSVTADLLIDGKPAGQVPPFVHTVPAGEHRIELRAEGYKPFIAAVRIPSGGRPIELDAQLVPDGPMQVEGVVLSQPRPAAPAEEKPGRR